MAKHFSSQPFKVIIERDEDGLLVASVPSLPGCYTQAKTLPELRERVRDAIKLCLDIAKKDRRYRERIANFAYEPSFVGMELVRV